jgi:hypothetical protein
MLNPPSLLAQYRRPLGVLAERWSMSFTAVLILLSISVIWVMDGIERTVMNRKWGIRYVVSKDNFWKGLRYVF